MKKALFIALLAMFAVSPVRAQYSNITSIQLRNANNSIAQSFQGPFDIKVGAHCTWSISGVIATIDCSGGGAAPGGATGTVQYNAGAGALGGITNTLAGSADCSGVGDPCFIKFTTPGASYDPIFFGTNTAGPMDNYFDMYQFTTGGLFFDTASGDGDIASFGIDGSDAQTYLTATSSMHMPTGLVLQTDSRLVNIGRIQFNTSYATAITSANFSAGAGWGSTPTLVGQGSDNNWTIQFTAGGAGIAANPTFTFTYADGDFSSGNSVVLYTCSQSGGDDVLADVTTTTRNQTNEIFTWHGTPTTGKIYEITCFGAATN